MLKRMFGQKHPGDPQVNGLGNPSCTPHGIRSAQREPPAPDSGELRNQLVHDLKDLIRRLLKEVEEHNADYKYRTPQSLIDEARKTIG